MDRNAIAEQQATALKLEVLRAYFDFRDGRPTAEQVAQQLNLPLATVRKWLADERNASLLDQVVPLWPNIGGAREFASEHVPEALQVVADTMRGRHGARPKDRYEAARFLLALAGVRPSDSPADPQSEAEGQKRPAVLLNLFLTGGSGEKAIQVVEGEARELPGPRNRVTES